MSLEQRLEKLEREQNQLLRLVKRWRAGCILLAGALMVATVMGLKTETPVADVVRAKRFEVINKAGETVVFMDTWLDGGWVHVSNNDNASIFSARQNHEGHGVAGTYDAQGQRLVELGVSENGAGRIETKDKLGRTQVTIASGDIGGEVSACNIAGEAVAAMRINTAGGGEFAQRGLMGAWKALGTIVASAAGEAEKSPADLIAKEGDRVTYDYRTTRTMGDGQKRITDSEYVITMLDAVDTDTGRARWLEITRPSFRGQIGVYRVLIPEEHLTGKSDPFAHILKGFQRGEDGQIEPFSDRMMGFAPRILPAVPYFEDLAGDETAKVKAGDQTLDCRVRTGTTKSESPDGNFKSQSKGKLWLNDKVPFGLVKADVTTEYTFGNRDGKSSTTVTLRKIEKDAKSQLFTNQ